MGTFTGDCLVLSADVASYVFLECPSIITSHPIDCLVSYHLVDRGFLNIPRVQVASDHRVSSPDYHAGVNIRRANDLREPFKV